MLIDDTSTLGQGSVRVCQAGVAMGGRVPPERRRAAGILGAWEGSDLTVRELLDELADDFMSLAVGAVGRYGNSDVTWLQRFGGDANDDDIT